MAYLATSHLRVSQGEDRKFGSHVALFTIDVLRVKCYIFIIGVVSNDGQYPSANSDDQDQLLAIGPMCRYAQDMTLTLKILADKNADLLKLDEKVDISRIKVS